MGGEHLEMAAATHGGTGSGPFVARACSRALQVMMHSQLCQPMSSGSSSSRRHFVKASAVAVGGLSAGKVYAAPEVTAKSKFNTFETDVLVCGGGCAGTAAALSAARNGAKTLLIEK